MSYSIHWGILLLVFVILFVNVCSSEDNLLDEYVRHVGQSVTRRFRNGSARYKRSFHREMRWTHAAELDDDGDVILRWQPRHLEIAFRVEARTRGYLGVGFSPTGGMSGADIVIGWVDDHSGQPFLLDCHASEQRPEGSPVKDELENYTLMGGSQNDTHTVLEFRRALDTCDPEDFVLSSDTVRVIWALHDSDPQTIWELPNHGTKRGAQSLFLLGPPDELRPENTRHWEVTLKNFEVPDTLDTLYWCKIFKAPTLNSKHHIVSSEPVIGLQHRACVHHMLLHECDLTATTAKRVDWERFAAGPGAPCYSDDMPALWSLCLTPVVAWAAGSKGESLPPHVGIPLMKNKRIPTTYYMLEVHFDNPLMQKSVDTSGLRIHYTNQLRQHEAGMLVAGVAISPLQVVPPRQPEYKNAGYCSTDCTREMFPKDGINVVSVLLHSHLAGRKLRLKHIRGGRELAPIVQDDHYDFNYQQSRLLLQEVTVLPGDGLITECTYSTAKRNKLTIGGYSTAQEMCLAFVLYYPETELSGCYSMPPVKYFFETFGVKEFYEKDMKQVKALFLRSDVDATPRVPKLSPPTPLPTFAPGSENSAEANMKAEQALKQARYYTIEGEGEAFGSPLDQLIIKEPQEFRNKSFMSHLNEIPWGEPLLTKRIEESFYTGQHLTFCRKRDDTLAMAERIEILPKYTEFVDNSTKIQCSYRQQHTSSASTIGPLMHILQSITVCYVALYV